MLRDVTLILGPVTFSAFEVPDEITFGETQRLSIHEIPGGARVFDLLGPAPADISWEGIFSGPNAVSRAQALDRLLMQGGVIPLVWGSFSYTVTIKTFEARFKNAAWIPYKLTVAVLIDNSFANSLSVQVLSDDVSADASAATEFANTAGVSLVSLQNALSATGATTLGTAAYTSANQMIESAISNVATNFAPVDSLVGIYSANGVNSASQVSSLIAASGNEAALSWASAFLGRLQSNMSRAGT